MEVDFEECVEECVVCLEECNMDISGLRIDDCECKCKYKIHFECLAKYLESNNRKCLYCGEEVFATNIIDQEIISIQRSGNNSTICYDRELIFFIFFFLILFFLIILLFIIL